MVRVYNNHQDIQKEINYFCSYNIYMCYSSNLSILAFLTWTIWCYLLYQYGNKKYAIQNKAIIFFMLFIWIIQILDYITWNDLDNIKGHNYIVSNLYPIFLHWQPIVMLSVFIYFLGDNTLFNKQVLCLLNACYFIYVLDKYEIFLKSGNTLTTLWKDNT